MSQRARERYQIQEQIGSGGMATVYRATDTVLQRPVALKVLNEQVDPALKARFQAEAQAVAQLNHPNIVGVYDVGERGESPYIVMEHVEGTNLKRLIQEWGRLSPEQAIDVVRQVGAALSYAHRNGLVHCDVKPHNILIGSDGRAKLVDFGIAQAQVSKRRKNELVYGTPLYMAPEQAMGRPVSPRTDVYGLGLVLWESLTGKTPERPGQDELVRLDYTGIPAGLARVIQKATAAGPVDRYGSIEELMESVSAWRQGGASEQTMEIQPPAGGAPPPPASGVTVTQRAAPAPRRRGSWLGALPLVVILLLLLGLGAIAVRPSLRAGNSRTSIAGLGNTATAPARVEVPDFGGMTIQEAADRAAEVRLTPRFEEDPKSNRVPGTIVRQSRQEGTTVPLDSRIVLTFAGERDEVAIPTPRPTNTPQPAAAARPSKTPTPEEEPTSTPEQEAETELAPENIPGVYDVQMLALDEAVEVEVVSDGVTSRFELQPGESRVVTGDEYLRVQGDPAAGLEVAANGERFGSLLEATNTYRARDGLAPVDGPMTYIVFGDAPAPAIEDEPVEQQPADEPPADEDAPAEDDEDGEDNNSGRGNGDNGKEKGKGKRDG